MPEGVGADRLAPHTEEEMKQLWVDGELPKLSGKVLLAEYDPEWPALFEREATRIRGALGDRVLLLEHLGSTSVPGLPAKPIIDMSLVVPDSSDEESYVPDLVAAGYRLVIREPDWYEHRAFKGPDTNVNLHVFSPGAAEVERHIRFRNWLRSHPADRDRYAATKRELAARDWEYIQHYADAKTDVIVEILDRAAG
jgi:GrpB-like predicted nucleotidyltransferase (UPF0157 family)